jgi:hypothetical protein
MDDSGIAYGFASVVVLLVVWALLWVMFIPFVNAMGDGLNDMAPDEKVSWQTFATFQLVQTMYTYGVPIFILLIGLYYAIDRALLKRKEEMYG